MVILKCVTCVTIPKGYLYLFDDLLLVVEIKHGTWMSKREYRRVFEALEVHSAILRNVEDVEGIQLFNLCMLWSFYG